MNSDYYEILPSENEQISKSGIKSLLNDIRPAWKAKKLIQRVENILPIDPSSACQRLFNAAIHDLKEKIIVLGLDLAKEVASNYKLPSVYKEEDILEYNVSKTIDLAYRIGILSRPEWRRLHRCYEIRRDLEHEDNEYEAVLADCIYIFKTTIDVVLAIDPKELLRVTDAKELVESPSNISISEEFLESFKKAPKIRQKEISELLISYALNDNKPDIVRENSVELLRKVKPLTENTVTIELGAILESKIGNTGLDFKIAKVGHACGASAYFKKVKLKDFYNFLIKGIEGITSDWNKQTNMCLKIEDIGGLQYCPNEIYQQFLKQLVLFYLGERSYGRYSNSRPVFYSNGAVPIIERVIEGDRVRVGVYIEKLREDKKIKQIIEYPPILRRFEKLVDITDINDE